MTADQGPPAAGPQYASLASVTGLAREVEALRRGAAQMAGLQRRVEQLAAVVARLADQTATAATDSAGGSLTWLDLPGEPGQLPGSSAGAADAELLLVRLAAWMGGVYLRYTDAARSFPACWLWHPDVVEELLWLHQAWLAAYADPDAPVTVAADWHDRLRPGVVRRIQTYAGMCSIEQHQIGADRHPLGPVAPLADAAGAIAAWWTGERAGLPPLPTPDQVAAAAPARAARGRR